MLSVPGHGPDQGDEEVELGDGGGEAECEEDEDVAETVLRPQVVLRGAPDHRRFEFIKLADFTTKTYCPLIQYFSTKFNHPPTHIISANRPFERN